MISLTRREKVDQESWGGRQRELFDSLISQTDEGVIILSSLIPICNPENDSSSSSE
jgi:hypothetical protein